MYKAVLFVPMHFWRFIDTSDMVLVSGQYDNHLVIASWLVATLAAYGALSLHDVVTTKRKPEMQILWRCMAGLSFGAGIWAMHFTGMIAYNLPTNTTYDPWLTVLSLLPVLLGAGVILHVLSTRMSKFWRLQTAAVVLVLSLGATHYLGMEAMKIRGVDLAYDLNYFLISMAAACLLAQLAILVRFLADTTDIGVKVGGAGMMGLAITSIHYTLAQSSRFYVIEPGMVLNDGGTAFGLMAFVVLFVASLIITSIFVFSLFDQRLRQMSVNQENITSVLPDGLIRVNKDFRVEFSNPAAQALFSYSEEELEGLYISQLIPSWSWETFESVGKDKVFMAMARKKQGGEFALEAKIAAQKIEKSHQYLIVFRDVTEREERERHVRRLVVALEQAADGILIMSTEHEGIFMNRAMITLSKDVSDNFKLRNFLTVNPDVDAQLKEGKSWQGSHELRYIDGSSSHVDVTISPIIDDDGVILEYLLICRDITDLKSTEGALVDAKEKAEHATQAKGDFLAVVSHEIRTPVNGILGLGSMLSDTDLDDDQQSTLRLIQQSGENLLIIINDILDFSKVEAGKLVIEDAPMSLQDLLRDVVELFRVRGRDKDLKVRLDIEDEMPARVYGDAGRIKQILMNLLGNAFKFTDTGQITVSVSRGHSFVPNLALFRISVVDTGIGMESSAIERIFEAFTQADISTTRRFGGTGLGLPICKQLVALMGGKIGASSVEGQGSVFWFELSLALVGDWVKSDKPKIIVDSFEGTHVLLVEDNPVNRKVASHMLKKFGCSVDVAKDGVEAIEKSELSTYDVIFMDCNMPNIDGFEATRRIRSDQSNPNGSAPIIALTARAMKGDKEACLAAGMTDYVTKPIRALQLTSVLNQWTRLRGSGENPSSSISSPV